MKNTYQITLYIPKTECEAMFKAGAGQFFEVLDRLYEGD